MLTPPEPVLTTPLFPEIHAGLIALLKSLSADDWQRPTVCSGWSVKDVAAHMLGGEIGNLSRRRDSHVLAASINSFQELVAYLQEYNESWVLAARRISPPLLIDLLEVTGVQLNSYFQALDPFAMGAPVSWAGPDPAPVWLDVAREYTERWHHQQHVREAVGKPGLKEPRYFAPLLAAFIRALPRTYQEAPAGENTSVTVTIRGDSGGRWTILRQGGHWKLYTGAPEAPTAEAILDQDLAWRVWTHGLSRETAREKMLFKGNIPLGEKMLGMVSIIA